MTADPSGDVTPWFTLIFHHPFTQMLHSFVEVQAVNEAEAERRGRIEFDLRNSKSTERASFYRVSVTEGKVNE